MSIASLTPYNPAAATDYLAQIKARKAEQPVNGLAQAISANPGQPTASAATAGAAASVGSALGAVLSISI